MAKTLPPYFQTGPCFCTGDCQQKSVITNRTLNNKLIDNFEYMDSPCIHGWKGIDRYPVIGYDLKYCSVDKTFDLQISSNVLDFHKPVSVFLLPRLFDTFDRYGVFSPSDDSCLNISLDPENGFPILTFKLRAPIGYYDSDAFEFRVYYTCPTNPKGHYVRIVSADCEEVCDSCGANFNICGPDENGIFTIPIGAGFLDGTWHIVELNLYEMTGGEVSQVHAIDASGSLFRLDDIMFKPPPEQVYVPYLFKIGPRYARFYESHAFLFYAQYNGLSCPSIIDILLMDENYCLPGDTGYKYPEVEVFETDPFEIKAYWRDLGADPNYLNPNSPLYGSPEPNISAMFGREIILDINKSIFKDPNLRIDTSTGFPNTINPVYFPAMVKTASGQSNQTFIWKATVGGLGYGLIFDDISPLPIDPFDGMPTFLPVTGRERSLAIAKLLGQPFLGPDVIANLESALYYSGFSHWPDIAVLNYFPDFFEDIILTLEVTNEKSSDFETFPIEVVNYQVENYPPFIEDFNDLHFTVGNKNQFVMSVIDPDCMIFKFDAALKPGESPQINHHPITNPRADISQVRWHMEIEDMPSYQKDWQNRSIIDPVKGVVMRLIQLILK